LGSAGCDHLSAWGSASGEALVEAVAPALTFTALATDGHIYYSASVDATSLSMQNVLHALGLPVTVTQDPNGTVRIASAIPDGSRFAVVLQATGSPGSLGTRTKVAMEWDSPADSKRGMQVLVELETRNKQKPAAK
jgi:hypothetical protein